jgi:putative MATE family efflux protein
MKPAQRKKKPLLVDGPVGGILFRMTVPMIFGMLGIVVFNLVDTFFVGQLGTHELAALSFTFPVVMVIGSIAIGLGTGAAAVISRAIGEEDTYRVKRLTTDSLVLSVSIVGVFVLIGFLTIDPLFTLLGATADLLPLIRQYMVIWYPGMIFLVVPMVGNNAIRATGDTKTPATIMIIGAVANMALDPLLIFGPGPFPRLELAGAALGTVIARAITFTIALRVLHHRDRMLTAEFPSSRVVFESWKSILYIGVPAAGTRLILPLSMGVITRLVARYGPPAVAAFGVATRIEFFAMTVVVALSVILGPFVGQNWGAGKPERVVLGVRQSKRFSLMWGAAVFVLLAASARWLAPIFNDDPDVVSAAVRYLMIVPIGFGFQGLMLISTNTLNVLEKPLHAAALTAAQMLLLYIPLAHAGSYVFGLTGVFAGIALAYCLGGGSASLVLRKIMTEEIKKNFAKQST